MKIKLPIIGEINTGKDTKQVEPIIQAIEVPKKKTATLLGSFLDLGTKSLSTEKSISSKLLQAYYEWVYINVSTLAEEISKLEPELYKVVLKGGEYQMVEVTDHPILDLLDRFNESTTQSDGFYITDAHLELTGDSFWYLEGGAKGTQPTNIYLLQPDKMELKLGDISAGASRLIAGYKYRTVVDGEEVSESYEPEEILHIKVPNPNNPYRGHSVVEGIATSLDIDTKTLETNRTFYENGMMAQFMLTAEGKLTQDQLKKLNTELRAAYGGSKNFWKVPIFGGGIKPETIQMSSRDAELLAQQAWLRDKIMAAFKNTKASLGITEDVNRANAEATLLNWKQTTIKPKMCRIVDALNEFLVPRYGDNLVLGFKDPVPEDMTRKVTDAVELHKEGIITTNEAREMVDIDTTEGGDKLPEETYNQDNLPKALRSVNTKAVFRRMGLVEKKIKWQQAYEAAKPAARQIMKKEIVEIKKEVRISPEFTNEVIWDFWQKQIHMVEVTEKRFQNMLEQFISKMVENGIARVDDENARKENNLLDNNQLLLDAVAKFTPVLTEIAVASGNHANRLLGIDKPYIPKSAKAFDMREQVKQQIELFAGSMIETDETAMVDIITAGLQDGSSIPAIKSAIKEKFSTFTGTQAERITRTEVLKASNAGLIDAYQQSGVVEAKEWLTAGDPCPICEELQGETQSLTDNFLDKGDVVSYTNEKGEPATFEISYDSIEAPPIHPNCRCTVIPIVTGTKAFDTKSLTKIKELEAKVDKRTKEYKQLKADKLEQDAYIKKLEELAGLDE